MIKNIIWVKYYLLTLAKQLFYGFIHPVGFLNEVQFFSKTFQFPGMLFSLYTCKRVGHITREGMPEEFNQVRTVLKDPLLTCQ